MFSALLGAIPVIGSIINGITSAFFNKEIAFRQADVSEAQVSAQIIQTNSRNIFLNVCVDIICFPVACWTAAISWNTIIGARHANGALWHPWAADWMFTVGTYPDSVAYLPYAVLTFLLGNIGLNMWNRK